MSYNMPIHIIIRMFSYNITLGGGGLNPNPPAVYSYYTINAFT